MRLQPNHNRWAKTTAVSHRRAGISVSLVAGVVAIASCTPRGEAVSQTECDGAIATATYTWNVAYFPEQFRSESGRHRIESFASKTLENRNTQKPEGSDIIGPDDQGLWWPTLPERPTAQAIDDRRDDTFRENQPPELQRDVRYVLQCDDGQFLATAQIYRRVGRALSAGQTVQARYALGQLLSTVESGEPTTAIADAPTPEASPTTAPTTAQTTTHHVNPIKGLDRNAGTPEQPFKTITHALGRAQPGHLIQLSPGTYDRNSGERFPLQLKPGITLQGNIEQQGKDILILGGGNFLSPSWAQQNVSILTVENTTIQGITLSNPNPRGTAVWVEAGSPTIAHNVFTGNNREGVFVSGSATPQILSNLFKDNGGNGVSFTRDSGGLLAGNSIRQSGYGVVVGDRAKPQIEDNQISQNRSGVVLSGSATPLLRGNTIQQNQEDGIVTTRDAQPTLEDNILSENGIAK